LQSSCNSNIKFSLFIHTGQGFCLDRPRPRYNAFLTTMDFFTARAPLAGSLALDPLTARARRFAAALAERAGSLALDRLTPGARDSTAALAGRAGSFALKKIASAGVLFVLVFVLVIAAVPALAQRYAPAVSPAGSRPPNSADSQDLRAAQQAFERGQRAEKAGDWNLAFQSYGEAAEKSPNDRAIRLRLELARFALVQQQTELATKDILGGQIASAREHLQEALRLDPGYSVARAQLEQLGPQISETQEPPELQQRFAGPVEIKTPIGTRDFDFRGVTRGAYGEIARQFGLVAAFDGDLADRQIRFRVTGVDFETAMRLLGEQTTTFWRAVDARTFFVAADTAQKRRDYDPEIEQLIELPASETVDDMTETTRMIRQIVGVRRAELNPATHTLTLRDTPPNVALARALVDEVEKARGELLLEIEILEVDRTVAQQLGITPSTNVNVSTISTGDIRELQQAAAVNSATLLEALGSIFGAAGSSTGVGGLLPPFILFGGGATTFLAQLPGATANFSRTLSAVQQAQRVLLRVADGKPGIFFVGERFPITLAELSPSLTTAPSEATATSVGSSFPRTDYSVGNSPRAVATGEFDTNNNANLDLAVVNQVDNSVSVLLGNGDGTFGGQTTFAVGNGPVAITTGTFDLKNNAMTDLAVVNQTDGTVSILLGNADGTFTRQPTDVKVGNGPVAIATGYFDTSSTTNDYPDLAVVNQTDGTVSVLLGNGDGTFTRQPTDVPVGTGPVAIVAGSLDTVNNSNTDLAVVNQTANTVSILLGNGDGTFTKVAGDIEVGNAPSAIAAGNFDTSNATNNYLGLAVANSGDSTASILLGNGNGTFSIPTPGAIATGTEPEAILEADFNNDGIPDLVTANENGGDVSVFLGLGNGTFAPPLTIATGNSPVALASGDVNGDGLTDLAVANESSDTVSVILNSTSLSSLLTPNSQLSPYPASEYVDLGLKVQATPRLHPDDEVTLDLKFDISSLSGDNVNGIPILSNRTVQQTVRLKENQTSVISGIMQSSEINGITGLPGIGTVPVAGLLGSGQTTQRSDTELVIAVTPRQVRLAPRVDTTFYAGRGPGEAPPAEAPAPQPPLPAGGAPPAAAPGGPPAGTPGAPGPVVPPFSPVNPPNGNAPAGNPGGNPPAGNPPAANPAPENPPPANPPAENPPPGSPGAPGEANPAPPPPPAQQN
jgi:tetratricopeptide (TPR) repeat protein